MRIGQRSAIHFGSQILTSLLGFIATLYVAQALGTQGDDVLGVYFVIVAVIIWLRVIAGLGVQSALKKRLSEGAEQGEYLAAGLLLQLGTFLVVSGVLIVSEPFLSGYLRGVPTIALVGLLATVLLFRFVTSTLDGLHLVHVSSLLEPIDRLVRSIVQIALVFLGYALSGLLIGYGTAAIIAGMLGVFIVGPSLEIPRWKHFTELISYAQYSWLSSLSSRAFASLDTIVLGLFVADGLIGVYEISWNLASILAVFGTSISRSMFPSISELSADARHREVANLVTDSLRFTGLLLIPGLVGSVVLGGDILRIYGSEFTKGGTILMILVFARLIYVYEHQFISALNAVDRPDLAFRIDAVFVGANLSLNLVLVFYFGWYGAAVATAISAVVALALGYRRVVSLLNPTLPLGEIGRQIIAGLSMGLFVLAGDIILPGTLLVSIFLVIAGAAVYGIVLLGISPVLRATIRANLPEL